MSILNDVRNTILLNIMENITLDKDPQVTFFRLQEWDPKVLTRVLLNVPMDAQKMKDIRNWKKKLFKKCKQDFITNKPGSYLKWEKNEKISS